MPIGALLFPHKRGAMGRPEGEPPLPGQPRRSDAPRRRLSRDRPVTPAR
jgi:hypothetical protein